MPTDPSAAASKRSKTCKSLFAEITDLAGTGWNWITSIRRHLCFSSFDLLTLSLVSDSSDEFGLKHLACNIYYEVLRHLPAVVRNWFNNQDRRAAAAIDRYFNKCPKI